MIGVFSFLSLRYAQFVYKYTNILDEQTIPYELIIWNRDEVEKPNRANWIFYDYPLNSFQPFYKKMRGFLSFSMYMRKMIKDRKYDKIIILTTQTAIPLYDILLGKYKNKYIYDYRDVTFENVILYRILVNTLIRHSNFTAISSKGFIDNLKPSMKFVMSHNTRDFKIRPITKTSSDRIRVVFWGMIRQLEYNKKICDLFSKDNRFELIYHGEGYRCELESYCNQNNYNNIKFTGPYKLDDIGKFAIDTDLMLNCYENDKKQKPAMTVKFYDALQYGLPMLVTKGSYMSELVIENGIGFAVDFENNDNLEAVYQWIVSNRNVSDGVNAVATQILADDAIFREKLIEFCEKD